MVTPLSAFANPLGENVDLLLGEGLFLVGHPNLWVFGGNSTDEFAVIRVARDDNPFSGFGGIERFMPEKEAEIGVSLYSAVAADTVLVQDRFYFGTKVNFIALAR